jgi:hypothetical protein
VAPTFSWFYALNFFLRGYVKDHVYSRKVNTLDELKVLITIATANVTKDMLTARLARGVL